LHDDLGSKLLGIAHAGRDSRMGELASSALQSFREAVSRANFPDQPLAKFMRDLQEETRLRMEGSGHQVEWQQDDLPECIISSHVGFHLNRIGKEIVSNIIRHARATHVRIKPSARQDDLRLKNVANQAVSPSSLLHVSNQPRRIVAGGL
jgi:signal transduction histidine kinase